MPLAHDLSTRIYRGFRTHARALFVNAFRRESIPLWVLLAAATGEVWIHSRSLTVTKDPNWDQPFATSCQNVTANAALPRENAAFVMLTRNSDLEDALHSVQSIERHFNQWFKYPFVFLNNEPWSDEFISAMNETVSGTASFEVIPPDLWTFPKFIDEDAAMESIHAQGQRGAYSKETKAGLESYHHMCRFFSGYAALRFVLPFEELRAWGRSKLMRDYSNFFTLPALSSYKWFWRVEPDIDIYCDITYDPFAEMARNGKTYGYSIALQETSATCPTLFNLAVEYKEHHHIPTSEAWKSMLTASWIPWPFRSMTSSWTNHDRAGDIWHRCHYWSNFEIADLDFFRSQQYQDFYRYLDRAGGFYFERVGCDGNTMGSLLATNSSQWGDAPVHSLAVAMFLDFAHVHYFEDIGYRHDWLYHCPANAPDGQSLGVDVHRDQTNIGPVLEGGIGCRCECDGSKPRNFPHYCLHRLASPGFVS